MSFDTEWLDLREPVDHAARDGTLLGSAARILADDPDPLIVDLGCGTGSTARAFAPHLTRPVRWRLVDNDPKLLAEARHRLRDASVECVEGDLSALGALPLQGAALVTASALFDLVSCEWVAALAEALAARGASLYAALNYDGTMAFEAPHAADAEVTSAFNAHQRGDKGFGPALGPDAPRALSDVLSGQGFAVEEADSPWRFGPGPLADAFLAGVASAVAETGRVPAEELADWLRYRRATPGEIRVGHRDVLARAG